ncbi:hypothetical protein Taro_015747 [Colocasia esculenta]|uniref:Uncharacterized protein n=1 Tax=Colocasia esculenta TaxID=4460 RepID=A0A843ULP2_COLES|nr:hypothetical protein [Colocasia esculenta]
MGTAMVQKLGLIGIGSAESARFWASRSEPGDISVIFPSIGAFLQFWTTEGLFCNFSLKRESSAIFAPSGGISAVFRFRRYFCNFLLFQGPLSDFPQTGDICAIFRISEGSSVIFHLPGTFLQFVQPLFRRWRSLSLQHLGVGQQPPLESPRPQGFQILLQGKTPLPFIGMGRGRMDQRWGASGWIGPEVGCLRLGLDRRWGSEGGEEEDWRWGTSGWVGDRRYPHLWLGV